MNHADEAGVEEAWAMASAALLKARHPEGYWEGHLSSSALSTATAITALCLLEFTDDETGTGQPPEQGFGEQIQSGLRWLKDHQNEDGGWGDTTLSLSNISTTTLGWAAYGAASGLGHAIDPRSLEKCEAWLTREAGHLDPSTLARAIIHRYGKDRTFSVPILTMCALSGRLGEGSQAWTHVIPLPFELAALPQSWFAALRLPVVSYALPALIAIGQVRFALGPAVNPVSRLMRAMTRKRTLQVLDSIQPPNGGFLEATPLTSFVTMSLAGMGLSNHPVARRGQAFLLASQREDGSWPIDTNLSTWLTTLSLNALHSVPGMDVRRLSSWLLGQQYQKTHPYTGAAPGGWAWTDLPGGVPDADDTAGALLALIRLHSSLDPDQLPAFHEAVQNGVEWLINLQNRDGGIPTFCKGWGALPFDRSSPDLTAHALRAWHACTPFLVSAMRSTLKKPQQRALAYLVQCQRSDGSWIPLWFGNQHDTEEENPLYGTSRVLLALTEPSLVAPAESSVHLALDRGQNWLVQAQNSDGSWGGNHSIKGSVEETALAIEALASVLKQVSSSSAQEPLSSALKLGVTWLATRVESGEWKQPSPIGFYFAKLWYYEKLYPMIFTTGALNKARTVLSSQS